MRLETHESIGRRSRGAIALTSHSQSRILAVGPGPPIENDQTIHFINGDDSDCARSRGHRLKSPKTIRDLMILVAILGVCLGIAINAAPFAPLILAAAIVMTPQIIIVALCAYLSVREDRNQSPRKPSR